MHNRGEFGNRDFVVAHAFIEICEERSGFRGNYGGFPVGSGEGIDGGERLPVGGNQNFDAARDWPRANGCAKETIDAPQFQPNRLLEVLEVGIGKRWGCVCRP
jgi:hypothetical protein